MIRRFDSLFCNDSSLRLLHAQARLLEDLQAHLRQVLPASLARAVNVAALKFGTLTLVAYNPSVAAKLRQMAPNLAWKMAERGCEVSGIRVVVQVSYAPPPPVRQTRTLGPGARQAILETCRQLPADSPLRQALSHLGDRPDQSNTPQPTNAMRSTNNNTASTSPTSSEKRNV